MDERNIKKILIVGGGTAGWMTAAAISKIVSKTHLEIELIESKDIPTVGVGEATIPQLLVFNRTLGINEDDFLKHTNGTFKLGIEFVNWSKIGARYIHAFGELGRNMESIHFHHFWWKLRQQGKAGELGEYSLNSAASYKNKFMRSVDAGNSPLSNIAYAYQFDAGLYATYLRNFAENHGVRRIEASVRDVKLNEGTGFIDHVILEDNTEKSADLFIDCTGFRGLLIEQALKTGFEDWSHYLPCDAAWAVPCEKSLPLSPYTRSTAHKGGWQWRIPLQHRTGNGHVFSSGFISNENALNTLLANLDGKHLADPRLLTFKTGKRRKIWNKNCVAIGLSGGFMEPLESTAIHLVQSTIAQLMATFPTKDFSEIEIDEFNRNLDFEYKCIRDFLILHYKASERDDSEFWNYCRTMDIPESLELKLALFKENGHVRRFNQELFNETSWVEVFHGQGIHPKGYHPLVDTLSQSELERRVAHIMNVVNSSVEAMPTHQEFIEQFCKASI